MSKTVTATMMWSSSSSSSVIVRPLSRITTMGGAHRSGCVTELRLECGDGIRVDAGFRKRVPLRYCSDKKTNVYTENKA